MVHEATDHGWYAPGQGTTPDNVGNLLELHGVDVTHYQHASQFDLANELAHGHKVIVGVDSESLWHNAVLHGADHAIVVSGIDTSDPQHVKVVVSDPGDGSAQASYPLEQFLEAWRGSDFFMVATHEPAPAHLPEMAHFDYEAGHIHDIADMPYDQFLAYADHPADWSDTVHHYVEEQHDAPGHHHFDDPAATEHHLDHTSDLDHLDFHHDPLLDHHHDDAGHSHVDPADHLHDGHASHDLI